MYTLTREIELAASIDEVFNFFSDAHNLEKITPPWLNFEILTPAPIPMAKGTLIDYRIRLKGLPMKWRTRISHWEPPFKFVDEQIKGPYYTWHHTHTFESTENGTLCKDIVRYLPPMAALTHSLFIKRDVNRIFDYRQEQMKQLFQPEGVGV